MTECTEIKHSDINHLVALEIYKHCKIKNEPIYFTKLVEIFKGVIEKKDISISIDFLTDICMIDAEWIMIEGKWVRGILVDKDYESCLKSMYTEATT